MERQENFLKKLQLFKEKIEKFLPPNLNKLKDNINNLINSKISLFEQEEINKKLSEDRIDVYPCQEEPITFGKIQSGYTSY